MLPRVQINLLFNLKCIVISFFNIVHLSPLVIKVSSPSPRIHSRVQCRMHDRIECAYNIIVINNTQECSEATVMVVMLIINTTLRTLVLDPTP